MSLAALDILHAIDYNRLYIIRYCLVFDREKSYICNNIEV